MQFTIAGIICTHQVVYLIGTFVIFKSKGYITNASNKASAGRKINKIAKCSILAIVCKVDMLFVIMITAAMLYQGKIISNIFRLIERSPVTYF